MLPNKFGDALGRPKVRGVSGFGCPLHQQPKQPLPLSLRHLERPPRCGFWLEASHTFLPVAVPPSRDRTLGGSDPASHLRNTFAGLEQPCRLPASEFQLSGSSMGSHDPQYSKVSRNVPLLIQKSITHACWEWAARIAVARPLAHAQGDTHNSVRRERDEKMTNALEKGRTEPVPGWQGLPGAADVVAWFGRWPSFHDAEVLELCINRSGGSLIRLHTWLIAPERDTGGKNVHTHHAVVTVRFGEIRDLELGGHDVTSQNVIFGLHVEREADDFVRVKLEPCYGLNGSFVGRGVTFEVTPGEPSNSS